MAVQSLGTFRIGQKPIVTATFADVSGSSGVATTASFVVRTPAGVETTYVAGVYSGIANPSSNVWTFTMPTLTAAGTYVVEAKTTTAITTANEFTLTCLASALTAP